MVRRGRLFVDFLPEAVQQDGLNSILVQDMIEEDKGNRPFAS